MSKKTLEYLSKLLIINRIIKSFQKSVITYRSEIFNQFEQKHDVAHPSMCGLRIDNDTLMYTFGEIAWTRGWIFTKFSCIFKILFYNFSTIKTRASVRQDPP